MRQIIKYTFLAIYTSLMLIAWVGLPYTLQQHPNIDLVSLLIIMSFSSLVLVWVYYVIIKHND